MLYIWVCLSQIRKKLLQEEAHLTISHPYGKDSNTNPCTHPQHNYYELCLLFYNCLFTLNPTISHLSPIASEPYQHHLPLLITDSQMSLNHCSSSSIPLTLSFLDHSQPVEHGRKDEICVLMQSMQTYSHEDHSASPETADNVTSNYFQIVMLVFHST